MSAKYEAPRVALELDYPYVAGYLEGVVRRIAEQRGNSEARRQARHALAHLTDPAQHWTGVGGTRDT